MTERCDYLAPGWCFEGSPGCLLEKGHEGMHLSLTQEWGMVEWRTATDCNCPDCQSEDPTDACVMWGAVSPVAPETNREGERPHPTTKGLIP